MQRKITKKEKYICLNNCYSDSRGGSVIGMSCAYPLFLQEEKRATSDTKYEDDFLAIFGCLFFSLIV